MTSAAPLHPQRPSRERLEEALARIADPAGEGARSCLTVYAEQARAAADAADERARSGQSLGPLDGEIVSIKDLFDVAGEPTRAGSKVLAGASPARADAEAVRRLRAAGAVIVAKTNMSEFAFSGVGANPHYGTPGNPVDRTRVPGGSSSGAAVAVADGCCAIGIGTDTGGSTRIPAALCRLTGFKPSQRRVPTQGAFPLSPTLDSVGPIARDVAGIARADAVLAGDAFRPLVPADLKGLKLTIPLGLPMTGLDDDIDMSFTMQAAVLEQAGAIIGEQAYSQFDDMARVNAKAPLVAVEAWQVHKAMLAAHGADYDPIVRARMQTGSVVSEAEHAQMLADRAKLIAAMDARLADVDALILPTVPIPAPTIAEVADPDRFVDRNRLLLRNTAIANFFDLCAISLPCSDGGLMLVARNGQDRRLLAIAAGIERLLS